MAVTRHANGSSTSLFVGPGSRLTAFYLGRSYDDLGGDNEAIAWCSPAPFGPTNPGLAARSVLARSLATWLDALSIVIRQEYIRVAPSME
jgi:hypothetical protein